MSFAALLGDDLDPELEAGLASPPVTAADDEDELLEQLQRDLGDDDDDEYATGVPAPTPGDVEDDDDDDDEDDDDVAINPTTVNRVHWDPSDEAATEDPHGDEDDHQISTRLEDPLSLTLEQGSPALSGQKRKEREMQIVKNFDVVQMERYESYKRSKIDKKNMKKLANAVLGQVVNDQVLLILCGITKVFVGEVVESARILAHRSGHHGALMPTHIHEAYQVMRNQGRIANSQQHSRLFRTRRG